MGEVAIVTGASRGIGRATVELLERQGWTVYGLSRTASAGRWLACDVTDPIQVSAAMGQAFHASGPPTLLVNCAGIAVAAPLGDTSFDSWRQQFDVNVGGAFLTMREFLIFAFRGGLIVNIASTSALRPSPGWAAYGASKAALVHLGKSVLAEAGEAYDVVTIAPGRTATALRRALAPDEDQSLIQQPEAVAASISYALRVWTEGVPWAGDVFTVSDNRMAFSDGHTEGIE